MYSERFRSHHDAEFRLTRALRIDNFSRHGSISWTELERNVLSCPSAGKKSAIYLHVPYCDRICSFCNLNRSSTLGVDLEMYTSYLVQEIERYAQYPYIQNTIFHSVYFGGGTPTVLSESQLEKILRTLRKYLVLSGDCEITIESTLHNLSLKKALSLQQQGVNRLSIGVQTFSARGRQLLGRSFSSEAIRERLEGLREVFTGVLGIDIIYSYPNQSVEEVYQDVQHTINLSIDSVSFYSLMIHKDSALGKSIAEGITPFVRTIEEDKVRHHIIYSGLRNAGYTLLELSKLVLPGRDDYRYIKIRYDNGDVLPCGAGAGGSLGGYRLYSTGKDFIFISKLDESYKKYHHALGCLQFGDYDIQHLVTILGQEHQELITQKIHSFVERGLLVNEEEGRFSLTADGVFWGNNIAVELLEEVISAEKVKEYVYATV